MGMNIVFCSGASDYLSAENGDRRFVVVEVGGRRARFKHADRVTKESLKGLITPATQGARPVLLAHHTTPPMGPPGALPLGGNSTPVLAPVAAVWKSERIGERRGQK